MTLTKPKTLEMTGILEGGGGRGKWIWFIVS